MASSPARKVLVHYWGSRLKCLRTIMSDIGERRGRTFDDIEGARLWLTNHQGCTGRIGVTGFCMGGGYALALAPGRGFSASSVNYGGCPSDAQAWLPQACPIVGSFGGYPGVRHGFMNDHDRADATLFLRFLARISGTKYDGEPPQMPGSASPRSSDNICVMRLLTSGEVSWAAVRQAFS